MKEYEKNPMMDMAERTMRNCEEVYRMGLRMQEEAGQRLSSLYNPTATVREGQKRFMNVASMFDEMIPIIQEHTKETLTVVSKNAEQGVDLMKKTAETLQSPVTENPGKWVELWKSSIRATRSTTDALIHINTQALDCWMDFLLKNVDVPLPPKPEPATKASGAKG